MTALTATATAALIALAYYVECAVFPWGKCRKCQGNGKKMSPAGRHWRDCRRCKGTGRRMRVGRRVWRYLRRHAAGR
ncbi:hypothetical protein ACIODS_04265 [Micromonospora chalcea]|uniref:hypothetical protein n=1 Tax=Micromonospora chalcea TaxID=1874 RepID=UPI003802D9E4